MTVFAIGTYIAILDRNSVPRLGQAWQNFYQSGGTRGVYDDELDVNISYTFAGFNYSGGSVDLQSASITASLVMAHNSVSLSAFNAATDNQDLLLVKSVWIDPETLAEQAGVYLRDMFVILGFSHDLNRLNVRLGTPLEAVGAQTHRYLTSDLVGSLPPNGSLSILG